MPPVRQLLGERVAGEESLDSRLVIPTGDKPNPTEIGPR